MKNSKVLLSVIMVMVLIVVSVAPTFAVIAPEDSAPGVAQVSKINSVLAEKMATATEEELLPVWVWLTDIDTDKLERDIEQKTGITQKKLDEARAEITIESAKNTTLSTSATSAETKAQMEKIASDTEKYLSAKKLLASQSYTTANATKIRQLGVDNNKITYRSKLTPSFVAYMTKQEAIATSLSNNVVEIGYYEEYVEEQEEAVVEETTQTRSVEDSTQPPTEYPILDVSTMHTGIKEAIQHDDALQKYNVTGKEITVLHINGEYVLDDEELYESIPNRNKVINYAGGNEISHSGPLPAQYQGDPTSHTNGCVSYLQAFAEDVTVYVVAKNSYFEGYNELPYGDPNRLNTYDDIESLILQKKIDLINSSANEWANAYSQSFSAKWFDAIVSCYNIPLIASAGNQRPNYSNVIAPASGYNAVAVGVYDYQTGRMKNNYVYTTSTDDTTRVTYKPDLVVAMDSTGPNFGATSCGSPVVSAIVAMMMELNPSLKGQPEQIKSILLASCQEKAAPASDDEAQEEITSGLTPKQGAGKVNALRALNIANFKTYGNGTLEQSENTALARSITLSSLVHGSNAINPPISASLVWFRENTKTTNNSSNTNSINLGVNNNLFLQFACVDENIDIKSEAVNSGKQFLYCPSAEFDKEYEINVYRNPTNNTSDVKYYYAFGVGDFEKAMNKVEITGKTAIGRTLSATAFTNDTLQAEDGTIIYRWQVSDSGTGWQDIDGAMARTYTITEAEFGKFIRCRVTQRYLGWIHIKQQMPIKVVRFGDANLDGAVTILDVTTIQRYLSRQIVFDKEQMLAADVTGDGNVTILDVNQVRSYISNTITHFPVEE